MTENFQTQRWCAACNRNTLHLSTVNDAPNHLLHFFLTLVTCSLWIIPWAFYTISYNLNRATSQYHCQQCGQIN